MPKNIVYEDEFHIKPYDADRFISNLRQYGNVDSEKVNEGLKEFEIYDTLHVSCLVEVGVRALPEEAARKYYEDHKDWFETIPDFERLRRITGYLVGTLSRWNDAKKAEEKARVKHSLAGQYTDEEKAAIEILKLENSVMTQI